MPRFPGRKTRWSGFDRFDFECEGRPATVVAPTRAAAGRPWLWRADFFGAFANVDRALLADGWHLAFLAARDPFGGPDTIRGWEAFHRQLTRGHGLAKRAVVLGLSRGALAAYRWAAAHPETVALIYGDAPVCDVKSWPGGTGRARRAAADWRRFRQVFGLTERQAMAWRGNPVDLLQPIARAGIPLLHVVGDADDVVPVEENTAVLRDRYRKLGGRIEVIVKNGVGHHPHGLADPTPILEFIRRHVRRRLRPVQRR